MICHERMAEEEEEDAGDEKCALWVASCVEACACVSGIIETFVPTSQPCAAFSDIFQCV